MPSFNATMTLARIHNGAEFADTVHESDLAAFGAVTTADPEGRAQITITLEATSLHQAGILALRLLAPFTDSLRLDLLTTEAYDSADNEAPVMLSVSQAAERLAVNRQAVLGRIKRGTLEAHKVGKQWAIPEAALNA